MRHLATLCLAEFLAIKGFAALALGLVSYLYWLGFREKARRRREHQFLENRRRELTEKRLDRTP